MKSKLKLLLASVFLIACAPSVGTGGTGQSGSFAEFGHKYHVICSGGMYDGIVFWKDNNTIVEDSTGNPIKFPDECVWIKLDAKK